MKNLFCQTVDFRTNRVIDEWSEAKVEVANNELVDQATNIENRINKLKIKRIIMEFISFWIHFVVLFVAMITLSYLQDEKGFNIDAPMLMIILIACVSGAICALLIWLLYKKNEIQKLKNEHGDAKTKIYNSLNVPSEARKIDFLFYVSNNKGKKAHYYCNYELLVYRKKDNIYFASKNSLYSIPISSIKRIYVSDKMEQYQGWNKYFSEYHEAYESSVHIERYRSATWRYMKNSYHIEIELNGEVYEMIIPNYDFRDFEQIYSDF